MGSFRSRHGGRLRANRRAKQLISRYKETRYNNLEAANPRTHDYLERDYGAARAGYAAGRDVRLHRAAGYDQRDLLERNV